MSTEYYRSREANKFRRRKKKKKKRKRIPCMYMYMYINTQILQKPIP